MSLIIVEFEYDTLLKLLNKFKHYHNIYGE